MLFQHDPAEPIGTWKVIREDGRGLYVEGVLSEGVSRAREVRELLKARAVDGLSIGFQTVRAKSDPKTGIRQILEADPSMENPDTVNPKAQWREPTRTWRKCWPAVCLKTTVANGREVLG